MCHFEGAVFEGHEPTGTGARPLGEGAQVDTVLHCSERRGERDLGEIQMLTRINILRLGCGINI